MELLFLVAQCKAGDTINLHSKTIIRKSLRSGLERWWYSENRSELLNAIEKCIYEEFKSVYKLNTLDEYHNYDVYICKIIKGLEALIFTYASDVNIVNRLNKLIDYFNTIRPKSSLLHCINSYGHLLNIKKKLGIASIL